MNVELISVGTEILLGNIVNTNAQFLAEKCASLGIFCYSQTTVGDNKERLQEVVEQALKRADLIILTGGLGPTKDDLTKETIAAAMGRKLVEDTSWKMQIEKYFEERNIHEIAQSNWKQAMVIEGAKIVFNHNGTAPGEIVEREQGGIVILLPGPPNEMIPMFEESIYPYLKAKTECVLVSKMVKLCGIGESRAEEMIEDLMDAQTNPTIAPYAKTCEVHFRVTAAAKDEKEGETLVMPVVNELLNRFGHAVYTIEENVTLEEAVVTLLKEKNYTLTTAESLTGGQIAATLIKVPGASDVIHEGYVTYSEEAKHRILNVTAESLEKNGVVSEEVAEEMAVGAWKTAGSNVAIAVTGIAGPDGGTAEKPVGLVYMSCCLNGKTTTEKYIFKGNRQKIRDCTTVTALNLVRKCILSGKK